MNTSAPDDGRTLIDELLGEQQRLTAVERFSKRHEADAIPAQAKYYRDLIPLTKPQPGQQYAFEVDLDKCSGCKACVSACHSLNGLDDGETWRETGLLFSDDWRQPFQQTVTTACHHCADPACLNGCPVLAYDKDTVTGIVRHLDDQCIGCQYCVMKCPYDVPKYSASRGIVRKCDMCSSRLAVGEAPACAQACPSEAIRITIVERAAVEASARNGQMLLAAPDSNYTLPTTRYLSGRKLPATLRAGDHTQVTPARPHLPLVFMLVLSQFSIGASVAAIFTEPARWLELIAAISGILGFAIAPLHLGRPLKAWRSFLGWRKSWFSREIIVFSGYIPLVTIAALLLWFTGAHQTTNLGGRLAMHLSLKIAAAVVGMAGVACSAMIYADTRRAFWSVTQSFGKFFGTALLLGPAATLTVLLCLRMANSTAGIVSGAMVFAITAAKLAFEHQIFRHWVDEETPAPTPLNKTARLLAGELGFATRVRIFCGILGGVSLPMLLLSHHESAHEYATVAAVVALAFCIAGELLERFLFFTAVAPEKMPGNPAS